MCEIDAAVYQVLAFTEPGDRDWSWKSQFEWLEEHHQSALNLLMVDLSLNGQKFPLYIGDDGRLWDGHHRLWCAVHLGWPTIRVDTSCENCEGRRNAA